MSKEGSVIFILSHMHEDHLKGLVGNTHDPDAKPDITWDYGSIYCSALTHRLMLLRFPNLKYFLKPIEYGQEIVIHTFR